MNSNCLDGLQCPGCGSEEPLVIAVTAYAVVHDDGIEEYTDAEWENTSYCRCCACSHKSTVSGFMRE